MPEDDMRERYEDMSRMREHVFGELDHDKDRLISMAEFLNYTASAEFDKDEEWKVRYFAENFYLITTLKIIYPFHWPHIKSCCKIKRQSSDNLE